ncbi:uncharacterized protein LY89DRAFT_48798 [Mollisia scopiformis]|uniref:Uncharacterized protein n=1 Tax=Mollisia scopiformis TaxID=149040 RepID=A0A194XF99_MOLSC|nr:uncharacterized protein LY89DRAFT_48798 [Mollisia scopiformis]KUJ18442.1 hypothetical protein LY89DRAFT_48798 [Mollisia scopiformis]
MPIVTSILMHKWDFFMRFPWKVSLFVVWLASIASFLTLLALRLLKIRSLSSRMFDCTPMNSVRRLEKFGAAGILQEQNSSCCSSEDSAFIFDSPSKEHRSDDWIAEALRACL